MSSQKPASELGPNFCVAPWVHTYVSPQGERRLCCASREQASFQKQYIDSGTDTAASFEPTTLSSHWNSEYMQDIRKRILAGEKIDQCQVCNDQVLNLYTYKQYFTENLFPNKIQEILDTTNENGFTTMQPISYDYRISNLCNFKCRMCGEQLSSSWESEKVMHRVIDYKINKWMEPSTRKKISSFQQEVLETELRAAVDNRTIEEIYWVGGEPLMWEFHWNIMEELVRTGQSKDVIIRYNTNLSRIKFKQHDLFKMLPYFKRVNICASIDGVGDIGEYIRSGLVWESWLSNFNEGLHLIEQFGNDALVFDVTLTSPGLFGLKQLFDVVSELDVKTYLKTSFAFEPSAVMSPLVFPRHILEPIIYDLLDYIEPRITSKTQVYKDTLTQLLTKKTFEEEWPDKYLESIKRGKMNILYLESIRLQKTTFGEILSGEAKAWWNNI